MPLDRDAVYKRLEVLGGRLTPGIDWEIKLPALRALVRDGDELSILGQCLESKTLIEVQLKEGDFTPELNDLLQLIENDIRSHLKAR